MFYSIKKLASVDGIDLFSLTQYSDWMEMTFQPLRLETLRHLVREARAEGYVPEDTAREQAIAYLETMGGC